MQIISSLKLNFSKGKTQRSYQMTTNKKNSSKIRSEKLIFKAHINHFVIHFECSKITSDFHHLSDLLLNIMSNYFACDVFLSLLRSTKYKCPLSLGWEFAVLYIVLRGHPGEMVISFLLNMFHNIFVLG